MRTEQEVREELRQMIVLRNSVISGCLNPIDVTRLEHKVEILEWVLEETDESRNFPRNSLGESEGVG